MADQGIPERCLVHAVKCAASDSFGGVGELSASTWGAAYLHASLPHLVQQANRVSPPPALAANSYRRQEAALTQHREIATMAWLWQQFSSKDILYKHQVLSMTWTPELRSGQATSSNTSAMLCLRLMRSENQGSAELQI